MKARIELQHANPKIMQLLLAIEGYLHGSGLGSRLQHLVKTRASQINGCAQCLDMHTKDARAEGESEQRLYALDAWRETPFFDERELTIAPACTNPSSREPKCRSPEWRSTVGGVRLRPPSGTAADARGAAGHDDSRRRRSCLPPRMV
jgi:AhpD family alkylhydroperoxidase